MWLVAGGSLDHQRQTGRYPAALWRADSIVNFAKPSRSADMADLQ
jgi:hypothetical protein